MEKNKVRKLVWVMMMFMLAVMSASCGKKKMFNEADALVVEMSMEQKIGQMLMVAVPGNTMNRAMDEIIEGFLPGGIIYFGYNLTDEKGIAELTAHIQTKCMEYSGIPAFISVDQEGGRVVRITSGVTQFPGNMAAGVAADRDLVLHWARILGMELRLLGINMNLAPVLDVNNNPANPVINTRSFGSDPELVAAMGRAYVKGLQESRCIAVGKHFPGHGDTNKDSHLTLPVIHYGMERLKKVELFPFAEAIDAGMECIMTAHIAFPEIAGSHDSATISSFFLTDLLRRDMKFDGLVMTDDMEMNAISGNMDLGEAAVRSVLAGTDMILISSYGGNTMKIRRALLEAAEKGVISEKRINDSVRRIIEMKMRYGILEFKENKVSQGNSVFTEKEIALLGRASEINESLSRRALCFYGDRALLKPGKEAVRIFISDNDLFRRSLVLDDNDLLLGNIGELRSRKTGSGGNGIRTIVYCQVNKPDLNQLAMLRDITMKKNMDCIIVLSGDPFPVTRSGMFGTYLLSFSGTDVSMRLLAECLNGNVSPVENGTVYLGIPGTR